MAQEKPQQDGRRSKFAFRIKPHSCQRCSEGSNKLCTLGPRNPTETEIELYLSISCVGTGGQWFAAGTVALGAADQGMA